MNESASEMMGFIKVQNKITNMKKEFEKKVMLFIRDLYQEYPKCKPVEEAHTRFQETNTGKLNFNLEKFIKWYANSNLIKMSTGGSGLISDNDIEKDDLKIFPSITVGHIKKSNSK